MEHGRELTIVVVAIAALAVGAATRAFARRTGVPYTVALLLVGLVVGLLLDRPGAHAPTAALIEFAASITPDLIIFVFLPALIFESAFALDAYGFRKNLGAIAVLAVIGMLASTIATAYAIRWLTAGGWDMTLPAALLFGALISATDPVAVVAILRELGAPRRLALLIEGESLMNDGTAIVLFNLLLGALVAGGGEIDASAAALDFARVVAGGAGVGLVIGALGSTWLSRTFNDPLVEITLTLVMAYAAMALAEAMLHVSGVMALVTAGLWMSSVGRPRISPEVQHFLHQFWQMLAYVANTLIFVLVGLLVAVQVGAASWRDLLLIGATYVVVMALRTGVTFGLLPLMNRIGEAVTPKQAAVMSWSGLRGAVSLALALVACQHPGVPEHVQRQLLLLTAGVVFLTIVVNGSTVSALLSRFGLDQPPLGEQLAHAGARARVLQHVQERVQQLAGELKSVDWQQVQRELEQKRASAESTVGAVQVQLARENQLARAAGVQQQVLNVERQHYWRLHGQGIIGVRALRVLTRELDLQLGRLERGDAQLPASRLRTSDDWLARLARLLRRARIHVGSIPFEHVSLLYDLSWATHQAAVQVLAFVVTLEDGDPEVRKELIEVYRRYRAEGRQRLEELRTNLPEMTSAVEARLARRIELDLERDDYRALMNEGVIDAQVGESLLDEVETEMKRLLLAPARVALPETAELVRRAPLFSMLDEAELRELAVLTEERVFSPGEELFEEGDRGDSMFVIARGVVHLRRHGAGEDDELALLGGGDILGEMALLSGSPRTATARAGTTVTVGEVRREAFERLMRSQPGLREGVWRAFVQRALDNHLRAHPELGELGWRELQAWTRAAPILQLEAGQRCELDAAHYAFLVIGRCSHAGRELRAPALVKREGRAIDLTLQEPSVIVVLGAPPRVPRQSIA